MDSVWPLTQPADGTAKNRHPAGDVLRRPGRPDGDLLEQRLLALAPVAVPLRWAVGLESTKPGAMQLTVIPNGPSSCASCRVKPICAALAEA